jgi:hypothetical protein
MCGVFSVMSLLFRSSVCCLWGDLGLLGFDRAMFGDFILFLKYGFCFVWRFGLGS